MTKELLFSVTVNDCTFTYTRGTGPGGQKKNKTSSACHCKHEASGATGYSETSRSQTENRQFAFVRMYKSPKFQTWLKMEISRQLGDEKKAQEWVDKEIKKNLKLEVFAKEEGRWREPTDIDFKVE